MLLGNLCSISTDILHGYIFGPPGWWVEIPVQLAPMSYWGSEEVVAIPYCNIPGRSESSVIPGHVLEVFGDKG